MAGNRALELLVEDAVFCESPRWYDGAFWYSDIGADAVWRIASDGSRSMVTSAIRAPSGIGWTRSGDMLVASLLDHTIHRIDHRNGSVHAFCGPEQHGTVGTNDMATTDGRSYVSCAGRVFAMGDTMEEIAAPVGKVIAIDHDSGAVRTVADGYRMPNGIVFTPDDRKLIFSELFASRLLQFDVAEDGSLTNEAVFADLAGPADGICIDAEGAIWASVHLGDHASWQRVDSTGTVLDEISLTDGYNCIATALGGEDGRDLFLVANKTESPDDVFNGKARSRIYRTRVDVPGIGS